MSFSRSETIREKNAADIWQSSSKLPRQWVMRMPVR